jgi:hypothetical protein
VSKEQVQQLELVQPEPKEWEKEWQGMPEYVQGKIKPYAVVVVRFETQDDLEDFSVMIGQKLTKKTKSIWHPQRSHWGNGHSARRWQD